LSAYSDLIVSDGPSWYAQLGDASGAVVPLVGSTSLALTGTGIVYQQPTLPALGFSIQYPGTGTAYHQAASGANAAFDLGDGPLSVEFWFRNNTAGGLGNYISKGTAAYLVRMLAGGTMNFRLSGTGDCFVTTATFTDTTNWHHYVCTRVAATQPIAYVDGVAQAGTYTVRTFANNTTGFGLGVDVAAKTTGAFNGWLSNVALYTKVLTPTQVANHYAAGIASAAPRPAWVFRAFPYRPGHAVPARFPG
jgi:hypothetical protein